MNKMKMFIIMLMTFSVIACFYAGVGTGEPLVPALIIMGDSVVDAGNNNRLNTLIKANFPPYGRDFLAHNATGRFSNGKLATDFTAESLGFTSYPVPYLSQEANGTNLLTGANFASGASGYDDGTAIFYNAITLNQQLKNYKEYQNKVTNIVGSERANKIFSGAIHLLSTGSSDFLQSYYINPILNRIFTPDQYSDRLMKPYSTFVQNLYDLGARKIGVTTLPPLGCLPAAITLFGETGNNNTCVERLNQDAVSFNTKLNNTSMNLTNNLPGLKLVVFDIYNPLLNMAMNPVENGFFESRRACCGTGTVETSFLCNARSVGTCSNATNYVFWDGFHPSEAANRVIANNLLVQGIPLIS
ncbi:GDSL-like Lipase/Acylhydrolase family protein [Arabidopsis thaliana]|uniref:GDSL-like Lipase/Acylhydrolase family protein n=1 Tax=Arabidopsis thaliana TaxID=3702 RepID=A0A2H1ZE56_ARATH|nr:GDSL-like Lipase/Acylhydrolase family protein [Arabidopsis thaliana]AED90658.2 GDSL-like Lipase/Acylhydrolase family protein [Arabidopsis thaliana]|eukprot:NP_001318474.1 GDSL-like Lipase/Acylhydrolase family protein [Arabidopsis thaliana]